MKENSAGYMNLSSVKDIPHRELFQTVQQVLKEENLSLVNANDHVVTPRRSFYTKYGKRMLDIAVSAFALIITLPINLVLALCTYLDVGKPIIFRQKRVGLNGEHFMIVKFRNMTNEKDVHGNLLPPSQRVTKLGKFARKTSLDELMNFWSILKGDMSLIGPRPLLTEYYPLYSDRHKARQAVRPGLECPMVHQTDNRTTWKGQFENDVYYVENVSFLLDIKLSFSLVKMVFSRKSTTGRGNGMRGTFMGYDRDGSSIDSCEVPVVYFNKAAERLGYMVGAQEKQSGG